jgi:hypothetical protein
MECWQDANERRTGRRPPTPQLDSSVRAARAAKVALEGERGGSVPAHLFLPVCSCLPVPVRLPATRAYGIPFRPLPLPAHLSLSLLPPLLLRLLLLLRLPLLLPPAGDAEPLVDTEGAAWSSSTSGGGGLRRAASVFFQGSVADGTGDYAEKFGHYK